MVEAKQAADWDHTAQVIGIFDTIASTLSGEKADTDWHRFNPFRNNEVDSVDFAEANKAAEQFMHSIQSVGIMPSDKADKIIDRIVEKHRCRVASEPDEDSSS